MDILQIFGDYIHLLGMFILLMKLCLTRNCGGISGKTQLLNAIVFTTRYMNLTTTYASLYITIMKIIYISITYCTVLSIFLFFRKTYDRERDAFRMELLILPCAVLGLFLTEYLDTMEVFWTFSVFLEAVSIVPQVYMVSKSKQVESTVVSYISCLGLYRGCYLMHWLYTYLKLGFFRKMSVATGIIQLIFYCDFFARNLPILKQKNNGKGFENSRPEEDTKTVDSMVDKSVRVFDTQRDECKSMDSVVVLTNNPLAASTEKIALLPSKGQRISD
ncbi:PREDICTED: ER lumen protein-retaining receptor 1-A-like [Ceratosolen solmsi marchali]|uniref:ER lumen protein-retaining receptor 1-A-like n=1 Tax=Ceratosolen solmsi marchali TaxID=326594 RepID=A0AAJ6YEZ0_9HYME|nr:PREDICTED: ER lumen protein-retaining receptor 1-A-like [Ceratosolen solmsi marchali]